MTSPAETTNNTASGGGLSCALCSGVCRTTASRRTGPHEKQTAPNKSICAGAWRKLAFIAAFALLLLSAGVTCAPAAALEDGYPAKGGTRGGSPPPAGVGAAVEPADSPLPDDGIDSSRALSSAGEEQQAHECPPCEALFGKLEGAEQHVSVILRGEPKSGTTFMYEWALNALMVTCTHLDRLYGRGSCQVLWRWGRPNEKLVPVSKEGLLWDKHEVVLVFDPWRIKHERESGTGPVLHSDTPCSCDSVKRVSVSVSSLYKHDLPVSKDCPWQHVDDITPEGKGCTAVAGHPVHNYTDTETCFHKKPCAITDNRQQMLILRDPRAVVVSSFFYLKLHPNSAGTARPGETVDAYVLRMLPTMCRFVHLRYQLLQERLSDKTVEFLYDESLADPLGWHKRWLSFVGLTPPESVAQEATDTSQRREFGFAAHGVDKHPGGTAATARRSWEDEISPEVVRQMYEICRVWLPPVLMEKFGIDAPP